MEDSDASRPQVNQPGIPPPAEDAGAPDEPNFEDFKPDMKEAALPRWLHLTLIWGLGIGAVVAVVGAAVFVTKERKTDKTLELLAVNSRGTLEMQAPAPVEKKLTDEVIVKNTPPWHGEATVQPVPSRNEVTPNAAPAAAPSDALAAPAQSKQVVKKKRPKRKKATALAKRGRVEGSPRRRGLSTTERLNAAMAACRANARAPGQCNIRACDVLGESHPACRE